jgi:hypothetical protein
MTRAAPQPVSARARMIGAMRSINDLGPKV